MSRIKQFAGKWKRKADRASLRAARRTRHTLGIPAGPTILMYHRFSEPDYDPWELIVTPQHFDEQLAWLKRRRTVLPLVEFADLHRKNRLPRNAVALTMDDGYACNTENAEPILAAHGLPATLFLTTGTVSNEREYWWDELERIVTTTPVTRMTANIAGQSYSFDLGPPTIQRQVSAEREAAYLALWKVLRPQPPEARPDLLAELAREHGVEPLTRRTHRIMTKAEVQALAARGVISIGAHTVNHPPLSELSREDQWNEIIASREACAELIGSMPTTFAYPFGDYSDTSVEVVREIGFDAAVTTDHDVVRASYDRLRLPRLQVGDWTADRLSHGLNAV